MRKAALLLSTFLIGGAASAATPTLTHQGFTKHHVRPSKLTTLYDQTGNDSGSGLVSQNFESSFDIYDAEAADDFIVPDGDKWKIKEIDLVGTYFNGSGPARSLNIAVYKTKNGLPGKKVAEYDGITGEDEFGSFRVTLPKPLKLKPGQYWVAASANMDFNSAGEWGFETGTLVINDEAVWRNPGGGFGVGCTDWTPVQQCVPTITGDLLFALKGSD